VRLAAITAAQRRLLTALTGRISTRLAAEFEMLSRPESPNVGVILAERGKRGRLEIPYALLHEAESDLIARDALRVRIKAARDRMLSRPPPRTAARGCRAAGRSGRVASWELRARRRPRPALSG
jgi:hypothetical protein